jgi:hypothetical protein
MVDSIEGSPDPGGDDEPSPDAGGDEELCAVPATLGSAMSNQLAQRRNQSGSQGALQLYVVNGDFDAAAAPDRLQLELWDQSGPFAGDVLAGTYPIAGDDASLASCGVCLLALGDVAATGQPSTVLFAQSGSVTIDSVEPTLSGSITGAELVEVDLTTREPVAGGCATTIASAIFSSAVEIVDGGGGGGGGG